MDIENPKHQKMLGDLLSLCRKNLPSVNEDLITKAFGFALEAHKHDLRASGKPYFTHPYEVAMIIASEKSTDNINIFNIGTDDMIRVKEIADIVSSEMHIEPEYAFTGGACGWIGDVPEMLLDTNKLKKLGWKFKYNSKESVKKVVKGVI